MSGDHTRFTFDPAKGYSGVLKQQGRVSLDADFNEFEEILDRQSRAEMYDIVGQAVVPKTTQSGFQIQVNGAGKLTIGVGRAYVDGILTECFGDLSNAATTVRDDHVGGVVGPGALVYDLQPFYYQSPNASGAFPALSTTAGAIDLVYLDVWQREVTVYEDPALREPALNGPDTATRVQTAWQVKILAGADASSCATPPATWATLTAPSTARLTASVTPTAPPGGPCIINPTGGYTGIENRLYRVEIHRAGTLSGTGGTQRAQLKWSRDNASLVAAVQSIVNVSATESVITVSSTGRDSWMRFSLNDYIELIDDSIEFALRDTGNGGRIMQVIAEPNHATGEIRVNQSLSTFAVAANRNPRIKRWDAVGAQTPVRDVNNGTAIALEEGISVTFGGGASDTLHAGDFWVFAARTADGSIDKVVNAPPRGSLHHFARLALVTAGAPPTMLSDCRTFWPADVPASQGCCTILVKPGEDIQKAIDTLKIINAGNGGCICLKAGVHNIAAPLLLDQSNVTIHGEAPRVIVRFTGAGPHMFDVKGARNVNVKDIEFVAPTIDSDDPMIAFSGVVGGCISDCGMRIEQQNINSNFKAAAVHLLECQDVAVTDSTADGFPIGILSTSSQDIRVVGNSLSGPAAMTAGGGGPFSLGLMGIQFEHQKQVFSGLVVERNALTDYVRGVQLGELDVSKPGGTALDVTATQTGCRIVANTIVRNARLTFAKDIFAFAIAVHVPRCEIAENAMNLIALGDGGIITSGGNVVIMRNDVTSTAVFQPNDPISFLPYGVLAYVGQADAVSCTIRENRFTGLQQPVFAVGTGTQARVDVIGNRILGNEALVGAALTGQLSGAGSAPLMQLLALLERFSAIFIAQVTHARVADNEISTVICGVLAMGTVGTSIVANRLTAAAAGIFLVVDAEVEVSDNVFVQDGRFSKIVGVMALATSRCVVARNVLRNNGWGIVSVLNDGLRIEDNDVRGGSFGVASLFEVDLELRGNAVEGADMFGISTLFAFHELAMSHNRTLRCGYRETAGMSPDAAAGIVALITLGEVTIDSCQVIDCGETLSAKPPFAGPRIGIAVPFAFGERVTGCAVASKPLTDAGGKALPPHPNSRAIAMRTFGRPAIVKLLGPLGRTMYPFADATDNRTEQTADTVAELYADDGDLMFSTNRCTNFSRLPKSQTIILNGDRVTFTGNQVRAIHKLSTVSITFVGALSAVGNIVPGDPVISPSGSAHERPSPFKTFNSVV